MHNTLLTRLKSILQNELNPRDFEELVAALISEFLGVAIAIAKSGFQHGADAGPAGRQGRRFRIETKRYSDTTSLSDRELLGEVDHAVNKDPAIEAWFLVATRSVPEQLEQDLLKKSDALGLPIVIVDWKLDVFPALAALCVASPQVLDIKISRKAGDIARALQSEGVEGIELLKRDLESWSLGFEMLRSKSMERLTTIWSVPKTSMAKLGQNAAGGYFSRTTIRRDQSFAALTSWWSEQTNIEAPAVLIGLEGVGKTWAALDWLIARQADLPIVLAIPSSMIAGLSCASTIGVKQFIGDCLYELTEVRDESYWKKRFDYLLERPIEEGPVLTLLFDGMNQEPSVPWGDLISIFQDNVFGGRIRLILTTRNLHFKEKLGSLRRLIVSPAVINVEEYENSPGGEFDKRLRAEGLTRGDLHADLIPIARTPRLFELVIRLRDQLMDVGQVTVHRLLWEYGRDTLGSRQGKSFSEDEWLNWLQEVARHYLVGKHDFNLKELGEITHRPDLESTEVYRRLSDIVDGHFTKNKSKSGKLTFDPTLVTHALAVGLLTCLDELGTIKRDEVESYLEKWFDPIDGLDQKAEILRAAVSIYLEGYFTPPQMVASSLVSEWLRSQNIPDQHRRELVQNATQLCTELLDVIERNDDSTYASARVWSVNALRSISRSDMDALNKIVEHTTSWLRVVSRDVDPPKIRDADSEKARAKRFLDRVGFDANGERTVLNQRLVFVERHFSVTTKTIASLLEGFPLVKALPVFELAALVMAIRNNDQYWDGLKWICLLNHVDFDLTTAMLRVRSAEIAALTPELGVHPELPLRVAALLLWLSGNEEDESSAAELNPQFDNWYSYERDYEANPASSMYSLEMRHAIPVLSDSSIALYQRVERAKRFFPDPGFTPPSELCAELDDYIDFFDEMKLSASRYRTSADHSFESFAPALARTRPDLLSTVLRRQLAGFKERTAEERQPTATNATEQLLLVTDESAAAACTLRLSQKKEIGHEDSFTRMQLLILEIFLLPGPAQIAASIDADLECIYTDISNVLKPISKEEIDTLIQQFGAGTKKQYSDLVLLLSTTINELNDGAWRWLMTLASDKEFQHPGVVYQILNSVDSLRFGDELAAICWSWKSDGNMWCNHYGSLALITATASLPFEQIVSSIAPWLLLKAVAMRGGAARDARLASQVFHSILFDPAIDVPDLNYDIVIDSCSRSKYPFSYRLAIRRPDNEDIFSALRAASDPETQQEAFQLAINTAQDRIKAARQSGASFYLQNVAASDFVPILIHDPVSVEKWLEGLDERTPEFIRRVRLSESVYLALCEALLSFSLERGGILWHALREILVTRFVGTAQIDELILMLFHMPNIPQKLCDDVLAHAKTDKELLDIAIAASNKTALSWFDDVINSDLMSGIVWRRQRARVLEGFRSGNVVPVKGAWVDGNMDQQTFRCWETAHWQHKEACSKYWWDQYWQTTSDEIAYAAWVLLLKTVDRRAWNWMMPNEDHQVKINPSTHQRRLAHFHCNQNQLKSAMKEQEKSLEQQFLGRKIVEGIWQWNTNNYYGM